MRRKKFTFYRGAEPVAELHLDLSLHGHVEEATWHGDTIVKDLVAAKKGEGAATYKDWWACVMMVSEEEKLGITEEHEGEPVAWPQRGNTGMPQHPDFERFVIGKIGEEAYLKRVAEVKQECEELARRAAAGEFGPVKDS
jgi:hypothetical protein